MTEETKQATSSHNINNNYHQTVRTLVPLFRVTVAWEIKGKQVVRVYEARSPQQAWQAAVLEKVGIESNGSSENDSLPTISMVEKIEEIEGEGEEDKEEREKEKIEREREKERERNKNKNKSKKKKKNTGTN